MNAPPFDYFRCPLHRYTFEVAPIRKWVEAQCSGLVLNLFAGKTKLDVTEVRNDLDTDALADFHLDALEFVKTWKGEPFDTVILDPPYSYRKSMEMYGGRVASPFRQLKDDLPNLLAPKARVITFGYHSNVMGRGRGFYIERIAVFSHGGAIHDTIASVERKHLTSTLEQSIGI